MMTFIILFCSITILAACHFTYKSAAKLNGNLLLGVTLPKYEPESPEVMEIVSAFKKALNLHSTIGAAAHIPILLVLWFSYISVFLILYMLWCVFYMGGCMYLYKKYFLKLYNLKKEKKWFNGEKLHITVIDSQVSAAKDQMPLTAWWFIPAFLICLIPLLFPGGLSYFRSGIGGIFLFLLPFLLKILFLTLYYIFAKRRTITYSNDTELNMACNKMTKRSWSICWILIAFIDSLSFLALDWILISDGFQSTFLFTVYILIQSLCIFILLSSVSYIRKKRIYLLSADKEPIMVDEDDYWITGAYNNPNDHSLLAPSRYGSNISFNMAHPAGRIITGGLYIFTAVLCIWLSIVFLRFDFVPFDLQLNGDNVSITAAEYDIQFPISAVEDIQLTDQAPQGTYYKNNGVDAQQYFLGNFKYKEYGQCKMYYYRNYTPVIKIKTDQYTVFFNTKDSEKTEEIYRILKEAVESRQHVLPL